MNNSGELMNLARERVKARLSRGEAILNYAQIVERFSREAEFDRFGFGQRVAEIENPGSLVPPRSRGWRGLVGRLIVRTQGALFWWIPRAFGIRDPAWRLCYETMRAVDERQFEAEAALRREISSLQHRIDMLEKLTSNTTTPGETGLDKAPCD